MVGHALVILCKLALKCKCDDVKIIPLWEFFLFIFIRLSYAFCSDTSKQCVCPPEFTGPHCEFLKVLVDNEKLPHAEKSIADNESKTSEGNHGGTIGLVLGMGAFALGIIGLLVQRQRRRNRNQHLSMNDLYYMKPRFPVENQADITMDMDEDAEFILQDVTLTWIRTTQAVHVQYRKALLSILRWEHILYIVVGMRRAKPPLFSMSSNHIEIEY